MILMLLNKINLAQKYSKFTKLWSPRIIAQMNDYHFKIAKMFRATGGLMRDPYRPHVANDVNLRLLVLVNDVTTRASIFLIGYWRPRRHCGNQHSCVIVQCTIEHINCNNLWKFM